MLWNVEFQQASCIYVHVLFYFVFINYLAFYHSVYNILFSVFWLLLPSTIYVKAITHANSKERGAATMWNLKFPKTKTDDKIVPTTNDWK